MALLSRRPRPPAEMLARLEKDERVVSWAPVVGVEEPTAVVATPRGLWWPEPDGPRLIGWHLVSKAVWRDSRLIVTEAELVDDLLLVDRPPVSLTLAEPKDLPEKVRQRVEASVVYSETASVEDGSVRFVGRRVPGQDGLSWWARLEGGATDNPPLREAVTLRLERLRAAWTPSE
ncbi:hypothetical protein SAMN05892883_3880 [Jatrophihabitans sp. GAS493]|uniref:hypothetical protein n=1 Tax=Jatrophihabitans sp. GAS493 TaxID=1907575 RepID=UPI000BB8AA4F|nr:hypothetical protein [Jatrophihabitans sp. GAS493]SOD74690.1 hypothetical protein SAMN05892883_3880 [Jatrophihabitans sp. GAS493]